jgi:hypothetical protein
MVLNTQQALERAMNTDRVPAVGICQKFTRELYDAPSVGDVDRDGDADAVDGWKYEPEKYCVYGDRNVPEGLPAFFKGGGKGYGHRCISRGGRNMRSSDMRDGRYTPLAVGNATIEEIERSMGVTYIGYSKSISGIEIPLPEPPPLTRLQRFHQGRPRYDLELIDNAIKYASRKDEAKLIRIRNAIVAQVDRLPVDKDASLVNRFLADFEDERLLRLGLLRVAINRGRLGTVRQVHDNIRKLISELPKR